MATRYVVTGAAVVAPVKGGSERYVFRGGFLGSDVTADGIKHLVSLGLVEEVEIIDVAAVAEAERAEKEAADKVVFDARVAEAAAVLVAERDAAAVKAKAEAEAEAAKNTPPKTAGK
jgi:hypothetical protein